MSYVARPKILQPHQLAILRDAPLTKRRYGNKWIGARGEYWDRQIARLTDGGFLVRDIDRDPFGRTADLTDEGRALLAD